MYDTEGNQYSTKEHVYGTFYQMTLRTVNLLRYLNVESQNGPRNAIAKIVFYAK